jgi:hypothetical protein
MVWDPINRVQVGQWVDIRVVSLLSTNREHKKSEQCRERIRAIRENLPCPKILSYQKNMFRVDKGDQYRAAGIGLLPKNPPKWYKESIDRCLNFIFTK